MRVEECAGATNGGGERRVSIRSDRHGIDAKRLVEREVVAGIARGNILRNPQSGSDLRDAVLYYEFGWQKFSQYNLRNPKTIGHDVSQPVLDRKQVRDIQVGEGTVGGQHQGYVGAGSDGVRPLHVDTGFELPVSGKASVRARASGRAVGGVDLEIRR